MNARYYNPKTGRFLTQDAMGGDAWTNNLYTYCGNNPVSFSDPTGYMMNENIYGHTKGTLPVVSKPTPLPQPIPTTLPDVWPPPIPTTPPDIWPPKSTIPDTLPEEYPMEANWQDYITFANDYTSNVNPEFLARLAALCRDTGNTIYVTQGLRSFDEQSKNTYYNKRTGQDEHYMSAHCYGIAIDTGTKNPDGANNEWLYGLGKGSQLLHDYGLDNSVEQNQSNKKGNIAKWGDYEYWHIRAIETMERSYPWLEKNTAYPGCQFHVGSYKEFMSQF